jgi:hypothetical protein
MRSAGPWPRSDPGRAGPRDGGPRDVQPARRADAQTATAELTRCRQCLPLGDQDGLVEPDGGRVEQPAHAVDDARDTPDDLRSPPGR